MSGNMYASNTMGIRTTTANCALSVELDGSAGVAPNFWSQNSYAIFGTSTGGSGASAIGLGINTASNYGSLLSLQPSVAWRYMYYGALQHIFQAGGAPAGYIDSTGFHNPSDEREKINIKDINTFKSLQRILSCNPKTFQMVMDRTDFMITDTTKNKWHIGLIAQEVLNINPHCVSIWTKENKEERYGINYTDFVTHLIGSIKEHNKIITQQAAEITKIQSQIAYILSKI